MKYSDEQRVAKIRETTEKLLSYIRREQITPERIFSEEPIQWAVTTPLYNIGEHVANLTPTFKTQHHPLGENCRIETSAGAPLRGHQLDGHLRHPL